MKSVVFSPKKISYIPLALMALMILPLSATAISSNTIFIEAENYNLGGEGVGYHDKDIRKKGNYDNGRGESVDLRRVPRREARTSNGPAVISHVRAGEWLAYDIDVPVAGAYELNIRSARRHVAGDGLIHLEVDGADISGPLVIPSTGGNSRYKTFRFPNIILQAGRQTVRLVFDKRGTNTNWLRFNLIEPTVISGNEILTIENPGTQIHTVGDVIDIAINANDNDGDLTFSASGLPAQLSMDSSTGQILGVVTETGSSVVTVAVDDNNGGKVTTRFEWRVNETTPLNILLVEAENYKLGGEGVGYHDDNFRQGNYDNGRNETVDLTKVDKYEAESSNGPAIVTNTRRFEWLAYDVNIPVTGTYQFEIRSDSDFGRIYFEIDGVDITGPLEVKRTNLPSFYQTSSFSGIALQAGTQELRLVFEDSRVNINWFRLSLEESATIGNTIPTIITPGQQFYAEGDNINIAIIANDDDGDHLIYSASNLPRQLSIDSSTGLIQGVATRSGRDLDNRVVAVTANDGNGGNVTARFALIVRPSVGAEREPAFATQETVLKLNALTRRSLVVINEYDSIIRNVRDAVDHAVMTGQARLEAEQKIALITVLSEQASLVHSDMTDAAEALRNGDERFSGSILFGMTDFVLDVAREISTEVFQLKKRLKIL